jgi:hypothetical protein
MNNLGAFAHGRSQLRIFKIFRLFDLGFFNVCSVLNIEESFQLRLVKEFVQHLYKDNAFIARGEFYIRAR